VAGKTCQKEIRLPEVALIEFFGEAPLVEPSVAVVRRKLTMKYLGLVVILTCASNKHNRSHRQVATRIRVFLLLVVLEWTCERREVILGVKMATRFRLMFLSDMAA
jgi:hypothetical protein